MDYYSSDNESFDDTPLPDDYDSYDDDLFKDIQHTIERFRIIPMLGALDQLDPTEIIHIVVDYFSSYNNVPLFSQRDSLNEYEKCCYEDLILTIMNNRELCVIEKNVYDIHYLLHNKAGLIQEKQKVPLIKHERKPRYEIYTII